MKQIENFIRNKTHRLDWTTRALVCCCVLICFILSVGNFQIAKADNPSAPVVVDWGTFDTSTNLPAQSMLNDNTIRQDSAGLTLYVRFNHNVAGEHLMENNLPKIYVISNDGKPVSAQVWVKPTTTEFQYRQYIFITLANNLRSDVGYQIVVAPGVKANNTYVNETGTNLFFSYAGTVDNADEEEKADPAEANAEEENQQEQQESPTSQAESDVQNEGHGHAQESTGSNASQDGNGAQNEGDGHAQEGTGSNASQDGNGAQNEGRGRAQEGTGSNASQDGTDNRVAAATTTNSGITNREDREESTGDARILSLRAAMALKGEYAKEIGEKASEQSDDETQATKLSANQSLLLAAMLFLAIGGTGALAGAISFDRGLGKRRVAA